MKNKKIKLQLNKETIAKLNETEMGNVNGGAAILNDEAIAFNGKADVEVAKGTKVVCSFWNCDTLSCKVISCIPL